MRSRRWPTTMPAVDHDEPTDPEDQPMWQSPRTLTSLAHSRQDERRRDAAEERRRSAVRRREPSVPLAYPGTGGASLLELVLARLRCLIPGSPDLV
jgi:hypothetical protein